MGHDIKKCMISLGMVLALTAITAPLPAEAVISRAYMAIAGSKDVDAGDDVGSVVERDADFFDGGENGIRDEDNKAAAEAGDDLSLMQEEPVDPDPEPDGNEWLEPVNILRIVIGFAAGVVIASVLAWVVVSKRDADHVLELERCRKEASRSAERRLKKQVADQAENNEVANTEATERIQETRLIPNAPDAAAGTLGIVSNIGGRKNQQDSYVTGMTGLGYLAVVSDGMGGLADGDKVSRKAVEVMLQEASRTVQSGSENPLYPILAEANAQVLSMLGPSQIYKCGATLLAVMVRPGGFHWVTVGDSRIYFYCGDHLIQLNSEHIYKQQLLEKAVNRRITFGQAAADQQKDRLISFLGMGDLKYIDGSLRPVTSRPGDKLLLMSDGVFNTISEAEIKDIVESTGNAAEAAHMLENRVISANNPRQDNFTCVILDL